MIATTVGPGSVPREVDLFPTEMGVCVAEKEGTDWRDPEADSVLPEFAALAEKEPGGEFEEAVAAFASRYGLLLLCEKHGAALHSPGHQQCTRMAPEPVSLWRRHAISVSRTLRVLHDLRKRKRPDPFDLQALLDGPEDPARDIGVFLERRLREEKELPPVLRSKLVHELREDLAPGLAELEDLRSEAQRARWLASRILTWTSDEWGLWARDRINGGLRAFPVLLRLEADFRLGLSTPPSVLSRVYHELAREAAGPGRVGFCSDCGRAYHRAGRAPKRGQAHYCPDCQQGGRGAKRKYEREQRKKET